MYEKRLSGKKHLLVNVHLSRNGQWHPFFLGDNQIKKRIIYRNRASYTVSYRRFPFVIFPGSRKNIRFRVKSSIFWLARAQHYRCTVAVREHTRIPRRSQWKNRYETRRKYSLSYIFFFFRYHFTRVDRKRNIQENLTNACVCRGGTSLICIFSIRL